MLLEPMTIQEAQDIYDSLMLAYGTANRRGKFFLARVLLRLQDMIAVARKGDDHETDQTA